MGAHFGGTGRGLRADAAAGRCADRPAAGGRPAEPSPSQLTSPLPPLSQARRCAPPAELENVAEAPSWSPVRLSLALYAAAWVCFAALAATVSDPSAADVGRLGQLLTAGAAIVALVLLTLSVAHTQVSGLRPSRAVVGVVILGLIQGRVAAVLASGPSDLWGPAAHVFELIGFAVPLAWVGGQFHRGVQRQRVEQTASLIASWVERARHMANQTVQAAHRHDVRSMLFVVDGAAQALGDDTLTSEQRLAFSGMLTEGVARLTSLTDIRTEEIQPFALDGIARAVVHAERRAGRSVTADIPAGLTAVGRAADTAGVLRTLVAVTGQKATAGVRLRGEVDCGTVVIHIEPSDAEPLALLSSCWEEVWAETFKPSVSGDEEVLDLYVAARLLADQGADLWSTVGRARFAVRLPAPPNSDAEDEA